MTSELDAARPFLARQRVAHLATADAAGVPHVIPVCFELIGDTIYSAIDQKPKRGDPRALRRIRNVLANPRAAFVADVYEEDWSRLGFVLLQGRARLVDGTSPEHVAALGALREKYPQYRAMTLEDRPMLALDVERVISWGAVR